jgi:hypothetical protein
MSLPPKKHRGASLRVLTPGFLRSRSFRAIYGLVFSTLLSCATIGPLDFQDASAANRDFSDWKFFREIRLPAHFSGESVAVPLDSAVLEKCLPDLSDLLVLDASGEALPIALWGHEGGGDPEPISLKITKVFTKPGKFTEVFFDKSGKIVASALILETSAAGFSRKVELRGSDNGKDWFVIRRDALLLDRPGPVPVRALRIDHPASNFQYLHLKVDDQGHEPLDVTGAFCAPPSFGPGRRERLNATVVERHAGSKPGAVVMVMDLGEHRRPARAVRMKTPTTQFVKKAVVSCASSASSETWKVVWEGVFYRIQSDDAFSECVEARFAPQIARYLKLDLFNDRDTEAVVIEDMEAYGGPIFVSAKLNGRTPRGLLYGGPHAPADLRWNEGASEHIMAASVGVSLGNETGYKAPRRAKPERTEESSSSRGPIEKIAQILGVVMLSAALLFMFRAMLKRRRRKRERSLMSEAWNRRTDRSVVSHSWTAQD